MANIHAVSSLAEIRRIIAPPMLPSDDMLDVVGKLDVFMSNQAVLATTRGLGPDQDPGRRIHQVLPLRSRWRLALSLKTASLSDASM